MQRVSMQGDSRRTGNSRTAAGRAAGASGSLPGCTVSGRPAPKLSPPPFWPQGSTPLSRRPSGGVSSCTDGSGTRSWPESLWASGRPRGLPAQARTGTAGGWIDAPARRPAHEKRRPWSAFSAVWADPGSSRPGCWSLSEGDRQIQHASKFLYVFVILVQLESYVLVSGELGVCFLGCDWWKIKI